MRQIVSFIISTFELIAGRNFRLLNFAAAALACGVAGVKRWEWAWKFHTFVSVIAPLSSVTLEVHTLYMDMAAVFPLFVMLAVRGRSPPIDQTIHIVFLAPLTLMTEFFGFFFCPALS